MSSGEEMFGDEQLEEVEILNHVLEAMNALEMAINKLKKKN